MIEKEVVSKAELSKMLRSIGVPLDEGITAEENRNKYPRIVYWPYIEQDEMASGEGYENRVTYQISFYARIPQHEKYKILRNKLREKGIHPVFYHEYVEKDPVYENTWHTYFAVEVTEEIEDMEE